MKDKGWKSTDLTAAFRERGTGTRKEVRPDNSVYISTMIEVSLYLSVCRTIPFRLLQHNALLFLSFRNKTTKNVWQSGAF